MIDQDELIKFFSKYLSQEGASEKTKKNYIADLLDFFACIKKPSLSLQEISEQTIQSYILALKRQQKTASTINRRLSTLRVFFRSCIQAKIIHNNPVERIHNVENTLSQEGEHKDILNSWHTHLSNNGLNKYAIADHINVVNDFLNWIKANK
jgi:site-specific recombinase XerD